MVAQPLPSAQETRGLLGAFQLQGVWQLSSRNSNFGGYSALLAVEQGQMLALSDKGYQMRFAPPGAQQTTPKLARIAADYAMFKENRDAESATRDPESGIVWIGWEHDNAISRHSARLTSLAKVRPPSMQGWTHNSGPEAMVRLTDGRFVVLQEGETSRFERRRHGGVLFSGDPTGTAKATRFIFQADPGFKPTDMAELPDGRVLILLRGISWWPPSFESRIMLADPRAIRQGKSWQSKLVARLPPSLPVDNFEGLAIVAGEKGRATVWLISDDNGAAMQRTLLWKLSLDMKRLPQLQRAGKP